MAALLLPLCAIAAFCTNPYQTTRYSDNDTHIGYQIVTGGNFTIRSIYESSTTQIVKDVASNLDYSCDGTSCALEMSWIAGTAGSTQTFQSAIAGQSTELTVTFVAPVPSQPFILTNIVDESAQFQLVISNYSSVYGYNNSACLLTWAPSTQGYEGDDVPALWSNAWTPSTGVGQATFTAIASADVVSWSPVASIEAGLPYDYHFVCYNAVGRSIRSSLYNYVAKTNQSTQVSYFDVEIVDDHSLSIAFSLPSASVGQVTSTNWVFYNATIRIGLPAFTQSNFSIVMSNEYLIVQANNFTSLLPGQLVALNSMFNIDLMYSNQWEFELTVFSSAGVQSSRQIKSFVIPSAYPKLAIFAYSDVQDASQVVTLFTRQGMTQMPTVLVNSSLLLTVTGTTASQVTVYRVMSSGNVTLGVNAVTHNGWTTFVGPNIAANTIVTFGASVMNGDVREDSVDSIMVVLPVPTQATLSRSGDAMVMTPSSYSYGQSINGCVLTWGRSTTLYEAADLPNSWTSLTSANRSSTQHLIIDSKALSYQLNFTQFLEPVYVNVAMDYHFVCYNSYGPSIKASMYNVISAVSIPLPSIPSSSSSSSAAPNVPKASSSTGASWSSATPSLSSSSTTPFLSSSSSEPVLLASSSSTIQIISGPSTSSSGPSNSSVSSSGASNTSVSSSSGASNGGGSSSIKNGSATSSGSAASSSNVIIPVSSTGAYDGLPTGTTTLTFSVTFTTSVIPDGLLQSLLIDINANIAVLSKVSATAIRRYVRVQFAATPTSRRLLQTSVNVEAIILGDIVVVSGMGDSAQQVSMLLAQAIQTNTFTSPSITALGVSVPVQQAVVYVVSPFDSTGVSNPDTDPDNSSSSSDGLSSGAIAGIVVGVVVGVLVLGVIGFLMYRKSHQTKVSMQHQAVAKEATTIEVRGTNN